MTLNKILILLNHPRPLGLLKIASELAYKSGAELKAMYLEDKEWIEASSFSFSQQISGFRGEILPLTENQIAEQSRALAARFKKIFTSYSQSLNIKYSYQTIQAHTDFELEEALTGIDLVLIAGKNQSTELWIKTTTRHTIPLLIWNNDTAGLKEIIGLCVKPKQSFDIISWTIQIGDLLNRKSRFFWKQQFDLNDDWMKKLNEDKPIAAPIIRQRIKDMSQIQAILTVDILKHFRNTLFVARRKDLTINVETLHHQTPVSVLLL